jgi:hypothetical protein
VKRMEVTKHSAVTAQPGCRNIANTPQQIQFESANAAPCAMFREP